MKVNDKVEIVKAVLERQKYLLGMEGIIVKTRLCGSPVVRLDPTKLLEIDRSEQNVFGGVQFYTRELKKVNEEKTQIGDKIQITKAVSRAEEPTVGLFARVKRVEENGDIWATFENPGEIKGSIKAIHEEKGYLYYFKTQYKVVEKVKKVRLVNLHPTEKALEGMTGTIVETTISGNYYVQFDDEEKIQTSGLSESFKSLYKVNGRSLFLKSEVEFVTEEEEKPKKNFFNYSR